MNEFQVQAAYMFARAKFMIGNCNFMLFPGSLIAVGRVYPIAGRIANDNEAKSCQ